MVYEGSFVFYYKDQRGYPIAIAQREEVVSLCIILNEWSSEKMIDYIPIEIKKKHSLNEAFGMGSQDDQHKVVISPKSTTLTRFKHRGHYDYVTEFERIIDTKRILSIIDTWNKLLAEAAYKRPDSK